MVVECKSCWWFLKPPSTSEKKGQCLMYGFKIDPDATICCEYSYGKRCE